MRIFYNNTSTKVELEDLESLSVYFKTEIERDNFAATLPKFIKVGKNTASDLFSTYIEYGLVVNIARTINRFNEESKLTGKVNEGGIKRMIAFYNAIHGK